jgi:hypothetical protein
MQVKGSDRGVRRGARGVGARGKTTKRTSEWPARFRVSESREWRICKRRAAAVAANTHGHGFSQSSPTRQVMR